MIFGGGTLIDIGEQLVFARSRSALKSVSKMALARALLPFLLHWLGTAWRPGVRSVAGPMTSDSGKTAIGGRSGLSRPGAAAR